MSIRAWLSILTLVLLAVVIYFAWPEIVKAWGLLGRLDIWILLLLIPVQLFSYFATGNVTFTYLRSKGELFHIGRWGMARLSLELNFVNHVLPSTGVAGFTYLAWVLSRHGVSPGRTTMSQIVRFSLTFVSFIVMMLIAVVGLAYDGRISRVVIIVCSILVTACIVALGLLVFSVRDKKRLNRLSRWLTRVVNRITGFFTRGRRTDVAKYEVINGFFMDWNRDFVALDKDRRILIKPLIWATIALIADVALIYIAFWALGYVISIPTVFIAFGLASLGGAISVTPGGAGVYEAIMVAFLATSDVPADIAIAGTLLARVVLVLGTIAFGFVFYQLTLWKYGKITPSRQ